MADVHNNDYNAKSKLERHFLKLLSVYIIILLQNGRIKSFLTWLVAVSVCSVAMDIQSFIIG